MEQNDIANLVPFEKDTAIRAIRSKPHQVDWIKARKTCYPLPKREISLAKFAYSRARAFLERLTDGCVGRHHLSVSTTLLRFVAAPTKIPQPRLSGLRDSVGACRFSWVQCVLATPVVLWCGWPFLVRVVASVGRLKLNMFTLITLGVSAAYVYSLTALLSPELFPADMRDPDGNIAVYFEASAVIIVLVLLGQLLRIQVRFGPEPQQDVGKVAPDRRAWA